MPKLSSFVKKVKQTSETSSSSTQKSIHSSAKAVSYSQSALPEKKIQYKVTDTAETTKSQAKIPEIGISKKALDEYNASKVFRWPDGTLRKEKPPAKKAVVLARKDWEDLVTYCRRTGGCPQCTEGYCLRHGLGVSRVEHVAYLKKIGIWNQPVNDMMEQIYMESKGLKT